MRTRLFTLFLMPALATASLAFASREASGGPTTEAAKGPAKIVKKVYVCAPCGLDCDKETYDKPGVCPHCGMTLVEKTIDSHAPAERPMRVAILLFNGVEIIAFACSWELFGAAGFDVHTVAAGRGPIKTAFGQHVIPDYTLDNL